MLTVREMNYLDDTRILITGGTGSLGNKLTRMILNNNPSAVVLIYSRDEFKQYEMQQRFTPEERQRLRFFLGDVRDLPRLTQAVEGAQYVIHTAALKQVPAAEYNPFEFVKTNVIGAENVIGASLANNVRHVVALSTDKAVNPVNLYGATKLCSDKLFVSGNSYSGRRQTRFSVVRYGNVVGSRGSVIPFFLRQRKEGTLPITHREMTRFWITLEQSAALVLNALRDMRGGEIFVPKIPSMRLMDLANVIAPECEKPVVGIRPGEKLHEMMIPPDDGRMTSEFENHFIIRPSMPFWNKEWTTQAGGIACADRFTFASDNNREWLEGEQLARMIAGLDLPEAMVWAQERGIEV